MYYVVHSSAMIYVMSYTNSTRLLQMISEVQPRIKIHKSFESEVQPRIGIRKSSRSERRGDKHVRVGHMVARVERRQKAIKYMYMIEYPGPEWNGR